MPKLNANVAKKVREADTSNPFAAVPAGIYRVKLAKVESGKSKSGNPMWTWHFQATAPKEKKGLREYTVISDDAMWKIAQIFEAFGEDPTTSTDDLLGREILVELGIEIQTEGKGKGQERNYIVGYPEDQTQAPHLTEEDTSDAEEQEAPPKKAPAKKPAAKKKAADDSPDF